MKRNTLAALIAGMTPTLAFSQSPTQTIAEPIFVTATRTAQPLADSLGQAIVISREDIEKDGQVSLVELLQARANVEIRATGGPGQPSGIFMRGANTSHTLVLVDGLRVASATLGATALENIPTDLIERIEIIKGPFSGLYGSDAMGGVIQIFMRQGSDPSLYAHAGAGTQDAREIAAGFATREGKTSASLNAGHSEINARSATNPAAGFLYNSDRDPYRNDHGSMQLAHTFRNGETLAFSAFQSRGATHFDSGPDSNDLNRQILSGFQLVSTNQLASDWGSRLSIGRGSDDLAIEGSYPSRFETRQDQISWLNEFKTSRGNMTAGADLRNETVSGSVAYDKARRETRSLFTGYLERLGAQQVEFNLRRDEEDQFGQRNTGSFSYGYRFNPEVTAYARAGRAFRAPSFNDLYYPSDPQYGPSSNPNLLPERSNSAEAGVRYHGKVASASLVWFDQKIDDLIVFVYGQGPQNIRRARIRGVEAGADANWAGFVWRAALTHQQPRDEDSGKQLRSRAATFGSLGASKSFGAWQVSASAVGSGARFDSANEAPGSRMGGYALVNAQLRYTIDKRWRVELSGNNLADKKYELAQGYNPPGRALLLSVKFEAR
jgi:vitamin B12 transporter